MRNKKPLQPFGPPAQYQPCPPPTFTEMVVAHQAEHKMFGRKHMKRTCRSCKHSWYVPWALRDLKIKTPSSFQRAFTPRYKLLDMAHQTQLAMSVAMCSQCGSTNYTQRQVKI
jgi:hypothetical protein